MDKADAILLAAVEDKIDRCLDKWMMTSTGFLDGRQRSLVEQHCRKYGGGLMGLNVTFEGGYEDAERTVAIFSPKEEDRFWEGPLGLFRVTQHGRRQLSHRDYLGALMSLGMKRELIGDILVHEKGADVVIKKEMGEFLLHHFEKAGNTYLQGELRELNDLLVPEKRTMEKRDTVASLRLDNVVGAAFSLSRGKAAEAIRSGMVFVNGMAWEKADRLVKEGDKLVLRGRGKVLLKSVGGTTRKDRIVILLEQYI